MLQNAPVKAFYNVSSRNGSSIIEVVYTYVGGVV